MSTKTLEQLKPITANAAHTVGSSSFTRYIVMVEKELLELMRSLKLLWVPLVFILLGIMQPVTTYYMPIILEKAGNIPEETVMNFPTPLAAEVLAQTLQQFGTLGVLVLVLVCMGTVSAERNNGAASLILVKPVSIFSYISSKWTASLLLTWGSLIAGYLASWYYTGELIGEVPLENVLNSLLIYGAWLSFVVTLTILFSSMLRSPAAAAFSALGSAVGLSVLAGLLPKVLGWSPGALSGFAYQAAISGIGNNSKFGWTIVVTVICIAAALSLSATLLRRSSAVE